MSRFDGCFSLFLPYNQKSWMAFSTAFFSKAQHSRDQFSTLRLACVRKAKQCMYHPYVWVEGNLPTTKQHPRTTH